MRLLLDTHAVLWAFANDPALRDEVRAAIVDPGNLVLVSAVSAWEVTIKRALGKLDVPSDFAGRLRSNRFRDLDITVAHALAVDGLPPHHADPFDRMLIAQATVEGLTIVTRDRNMARYDIDVLPA